MSRAAGRAVRAGRANRVMVVWCPDWPVVAAGFDPETPAAVSSGGRILACTEAARWEGVRRGQRLRDAQGRCPELLLREDDPAAQARAFEEVAVAVESVCARVEIVRPGLAAVPARGPARYHGGEQAAADAVREALAAQGHACAVGVADGVFAAALAARRPPLGVVVPAGQTADFLAELPVAAVDRPELAGVLTRLGLRTLGAFAALPPGDVAARFGTEGVAAHRLARGLDPRPPVTRPPGEDLGEELVFDPPSPVEPVVFAARGLAERLHDTLDSRGLACVQVEVRVVTEDGRVRSRLWRHDGLLSASAVAERVRWQLDAWRTAEPGPVRADGSPDGPARAGGSPGSTDGSPRAVDDEGLASGGISLLRLTPDQVVAADGRQPELWGRPGADEAGQRVERAATRIQTMLGHAAVTRPVLVGGVGPNERVLRLPWGDQDPDAVRARPADRPWPGQIPEPAPAVVHPTRRPVELVDATGAPVAVSGRCVVSAPPALLRGPDGEVVAVTGWTGPWPALERWWDPATARRRARLQLTTADGRAWLLLLDRGSWLVEATYALGPSPRVSRDRDAGRVPNAVV
ncbi:DNA polymerase Y family protein [Streptomyces sp. 4N509B]|uniref:DNA polymerase Y family protein n=1 Tax=Streptomyces sp. 4N509B TaxID=3457413 RepID=UPI003FD1E705